MFKFSISASFVFIVITQFYLASVAYGGLSEEELSKIEDRDRYCAQNIERTRNVVQSLSTSSKDYKQKDLLQMTLDMLLKENSAELSNVSNTYESAKMLSLLTVVQCRFMVRDQKLSSYIERILASETLKGTENQVNDKLFSLQAKIDFPKGINCDSQNIIAPGSPDRIKLRCCETKICKEALKPQPIKNKTTKAKKDVTR